MQVPFAWQGLFGIARLRAGRGAGYRAPEKRNFLGKGGATKRTSFAAPLSGKANDTKSATTRHRTVFLHRALRSILPNKYPAVTKVTAGYLAGVEGIEPSAYGFGGAVDTLSSAEAIRLFQHL